MPKIIVSLVLLSFLFFSGCTSCSTDKEEIKTLREEQKSDNKLENKKTVEEAKINTQPSNVTVSKQILEPFNPALETNISKDELITESLDELESEAFNAMQPKIKKEMLRIPECLENAENKDDAFECSKKLRSLNKEMAMAMGDFTEEEVERYNDTFIWNEETKYNMIKEIESSMQKMQEMQSCFNSTKTPEELEACLKIDETQVIH